MVILAPREWIQVLLGTNTGGKVAWHRNLKLFFYFAVQESKVEMYTVS